MDTHIAFIWKNEDMAPYNTSIETQGRSQKEGST